MAPRGHGIRLQVEGLVKEATSRLNEAGGSFVARVSGQLTHQMGALRRRQSGLLQKMSRRSAALSEMPAPSLVKATLRRVSDLFEDLAVDEMTAQDEVAESTPVTPIDVDSLAHAPNTDNCMAAGTSPPVEAASSAAPRHAGSTKRREATSRTKTHRGGSRRRNRVRDPQ